MTKITNVDKKMVMNRAHKFFREGMGEWAECLRNAWADVKAIKVAKAKVNEPVMTYVDWLAIGREVAHGVKAIFKVVLHDAKTKNGTRVTPFFGYTDTVAFGWNE